MLEVVTESNQERQEIALTLDEIVRDGARKILAQALQLEVHDYITQNNHKDELGRAVVVRNGKSKERSVTLGAGTVRVNAPRVNDRRQGKKFTSRILPPYLRRSANVETLLPILYLKGLSTSDFQSALTCILGEGASGLSPSSISALKRVWEQDFDKWNKRLINETIVYMYADGVNVKIRLGEDKKLCLLVLIGVTSGGRKKLLAVEPGYRESKDSWSSVLRSLKKRGLSAPLLAIGDGALGFWSAVRDVFPETKEQRCWVHKIANVLDVFPKRLQYKAKQLLHDMMYAARKEDAEVVLSDFDKEFGAKYEKAVMLLQKDWDELTAHFSFPAEHWQHLRTTNPIESTFATVKLRTRVTKGAGSAKAASTMAFKLMMEAEKKWQRIRGHKELANVISGIEYRNGVMIASEQPQEAVNF